MDLIFSCSTMIQLGVLDFSKCTSREEVLVLITEADAASNLPLENQELPRCPPPLRTYTDIDNNDPKWREKMMALGEQIRQDMITNFGPTFKSKSNQTTHFAAVEPVKITVKEGASRVNIFHSSKMLAGMAVVL